MTPSPHYFIFIHLGSQFGPHCFTAQTAEIFNFLSKMGRDIGALLSPGVCDLVLY